MSYTPIAGVRKDHIFLTYVIGDMPFEEDSGKVKSYCGLTFDAALEVPIRLSDPDFGDARLCRNCVAGWRKAHG